MPRQVFTPLTLIMKIKSPNDAKGLAALLLKSCPETGGLCSAYPLATVQTVLTWQGEN